MKIETWKNVFTKFSDDTATKSFFALFLVDSKIFNRCGPSFLCGAAILCGSAILCGTAILCGAAFLCGAAILCGATFLLLC